MMKIFIPLMLLFSIFLASCGGSGSPVSPEIPKESPQLKESASGVEDALIKGDSKKLKSLILIRYLGAFSSAIDENPSKLPAFGEIFKSRKLTAMDKIYAVYTIDYNGSKFEISFGLDEDGVWKLINF